MPESEVSQFGPLAPHYDELMQVVPYDEWAEYVMTLYTFSNHEPHRVLDCACGTGNVSFELAKCGLEVVGVDIAEAMIEQAQAKLEITKASGEKNAEKVSFILDDLTTFDLNDKFDSASCLYDSLNYILDPEKLRAAFARIAAHMLPGGVFVFDMNSDYAFRADLFSQSNMDPRKNLHYHWKAVLNEETHICSVKMRFTRKLADGSTETFEETHQERAYTRPEVEQMLRETGWELLYAFDAYTLNPPHGESERWNFVAQKI